MNRPFVLAQLSDLHIKAEGRPLLGRVDTAGMLRACVEDVLALGQRPDAVVITGDLVDLGDSGEYAFLRELLVPLEMPLYLIPGNHDERGALRAAFPEHEYLHQSPHFIQYAIDAHPLRIVALDTVIPGAGGGELCAERLAWLARVLSQDQQKPTVVVMHHPPFKTLIGHMDAIGLRDPEPFATVVRRHPQVKAILCGHLHRPIEVCFAGTIASTSPSCAHQVALDLETGAPSRLVMEPAAYRLHAYSPDVGLVSHTAYIGDYPGP